MKRISTFQLYCILLMMTMPLAFLIVPKILTSYLENNAWLAPIVAVIPGTLIIYIPGWPRFYPSLFKSIKIGLYHLQNFAQVLQGGRPIQVK